MGIHTQLVVSRNQLQFQKPRNLSGLTVCAVTLSVVTGIWVVVKPSVPRDTGGRLTSAKSTLCVISQTHQRTENTSATGRTLTQRRMLRSTSVIDVNLMKISTMIALMELTLMFSKVMPISSRTDQLQVPMVLIQTLHELLADTASRRFQPKNSFAASSATTVTSPVRSPPCVSTVTGSK